MAIPSWADHYVTLGTNTAITFTLRVDTTSNIIYTGTIYSPTGSSATLKVNVMPVVRDYIFGEYLQPDQSTGSSQDASEYTLRSFWVYVGSTQKEAFKVFMDWTLQGLADNTASELRNDPIIPRFSPVQGLFLTKMSGASFSVNMYTDDPAMIGQSETITIGASYTTRWMGDGTTFSGQTWDDWKEIDLDQPTPEGRHLHYDIVPDCHRWALDYLNAWGGWDSLLIEGTWREIDGYERGQYRTGDGLVTDSNLYVRNRRDKTDYLNTITKRYELNTALLTDDEASRMHHLLGSTNVYLRDLTLAEEYCSWAANIIDSECEYKKHDGGTWAQYRIQVEISQQLTRQG